MLEIEITKQADEDLHNIYKYSYENFGKESAQKYITQIKVKFTRIQEGLFKGLVRKDLGCKIYCYKVNSHVIYYKEFKTYIKILRVLHNSMDESDRL